MIWLSLVNPLVPTHAAMPKSKFIGWPAICIHQAEFDDNTGHIHIPLV